MRILHSVEICQGLLPSDSEFGKMLGNDLYEFVYQPQMEMGEEVKPNTQLDGNQRHFIRTLEKLKEQVVSGSEDGEDKLLVPIKASRIW